MLHLDVVVFGWTRLVYPLLLWRGLWGKVTTMFQFFIFVVSSVGLADAFKELAHRVPDASDIPDEPPELGVWMMAGKAAELTMEAYGGGLWGLFTVCIGYRT